MAIVVISIDRSKMPELTDEEFDEWMRSCVDDDSGCLAQNQTINEKAGAMDQESSR